MGTGEKHRAVMLNNMKSFVEKYRRNGLNPSVTKINAFEQDLKILKELIK